MQPLFNLEVLQCYIDFELSKALPNVKIITFSEDPVQLPRKDGTVIVPPETQILFYESPEMIESVVETITHLYNEELTKLGVADTVPYVVMTQRTWTVIDRTPESLEEIKHRKLYCNAISLTVLSSEDKLASMP